jgi:uroporphyrin-III C-methyltransferase
MPSSPFVYIVGAGPGDLELLTLKAHRLITEVADVVIYDRLIPDDIIALIPPGTEKIYAGKSCRNHTMTQSEINALLVSEAQKNRIVVRLKGGDPFIFGRGGEEAECLLAHHVPFEIVPGISAAAACSAIMGIPLTHRGLASSVRYITGHCQKGEELSLDWRGLANSDTTLVIYMGLAHLDEIAASLIHAGLAKDTPAAAIQAGTTDAQRVLVSTIAELYEAVKTQEFISPTLIIIGKVVNLAHH